MTQTFDCLYCETSFASYGGSSVCPCCGKDVFPNHDMQMYIVRKIDPMERMPTIMVAVRINHAIRRFSVPMPVSHIEGYAESHRLMHEAIGQAVAAALFSDKAVKIEGEMDAFLQAMRQR